MEKKKVSFSVPLREKFNGYWLLGKHYAAGRHSVEVDENGMKEIMGAPVIVVHKDEAEAALMPEASIISPVKVEEEASADEAPIPPKSKQFKK